MNLQPTTTGKPLRLRKSALFRLLDYEPHPGQLLVHKSRAPRRVLACGVRWGKSTCAAMEVVAALLEPCESALGWTVAPNMSLTDQVYERVRLAFHGHLKHRILEEDERERRLVVRNLGGGRSELQARTADNPVGLLGAAVDWVVVDEAARLRRFVWEQILSPRLIDRAGWALLLSTPQGVNWYYELVRRGEKGRDPAFESWRSPSWTNPHVDRALIEAERARLKPESFAQEYEARFLGEEDQRCDRCGGPSEVAVGVVILYDDEEAPRCPDCNGYIHKDGTTAVTKGGGRVIKIRRMTTDPPALPGEARPDPDVRLSVQRPELN